MKQLHINEKNKRYYSESFIKGFECGTERQFNEDRNAYKQGFNDALDKIRTEIADLDDADYDYEGYYKAVTDALQIIDKYKTESGDKE